MNTDEPDIDHWKITRNLVIGLLCIIAIWVVIAAIGMYSIANYWESRGPYSGEEVTAKEIVESGVRLSVTLDQFPSDTVYQIKYILHGVDHQCLIEFKSNVNQVLNILDPKWENFENKGIIDGTDVFWYDIKNRCDLVYYPGQTEFVKWLFDSGSHRLFYYEYSL